MIVSEKSLPQSTMFDKRSICYCRLYQKRACRNLQLKKGGAVSRRHCIRKEPAAIYNPVRPDPDQRRDCIRKEPAAIYNNNAAWSSSVNIVSEKSLPQSTMSNCQHTACRPLYQKRACRNLQLPGNAGVEGAHCIRKEPAAIYNNFWSRWRTPCIVSEKSLPQSTIIQSLAGGFP